MRLWQRRGFMPEIEAELRQLVGYGASVLLPL